MISYKVLIILTFIINISHCGEELVETAYGKYIREVNRCQNNLQLMGFIYEASFANYNLAMEIESKSLRHDDPHSENEIINSLIISRRTEDKLKHQESLYGKPQLDENTIHAYIHEFYNKISNHEHRIRAMDPTEFCNKEHSLALILPFWGNTRVASCVKEISSSFSDNPYSNAVKAYALDNHTVNPSPFAEAPGFPDHGKSLKYYKYILDMFKKNEGTMADCNTKFWCERKIKDFEEKKQFKN